MGGRFSIFVQHVSLTYVQESKRTNVRERVVERERKREKERKREREREREKERNARERETLGKYKDYYDSTTCHIKPALSRPLRPMIREREINESDFLKSICWRFEPATPA